MNVQRFELPEQARKIRDREALWIERQAREADGRARSSPTVLSEVCRLMSLRQRYIGALGEHYSVQDYASILVVDGLDERVVRACGRLLRRFAEQMRRKPSPRAQEFIHRQLPSGAVDLPAYPVAYAVLYAMRTAVDRFGECLPQAGDVRVRDLERALIRLLLEMVDRYVQTRDTPVKRHFSDVEREYSAVARLKCACGEEKFQLVMQYLHMPEGETPYDQLDLRCTVCGMCRTVTFDLPHFSDMYQL